MSVPKTIRETSGLYLQLKESVNVVERLGEYLQLHSHTNINLFPTGHGRNQPIYEHHVTTASRNKVKCNYSRNFKWSNLGASFLFLYFVIIEIMCRWNPLNSYSHVCPFYSQCFAKIWISGKNFFLLQMLQLPQSNFCRNKKILYRNAFIN